MGIHQAETLLRLLNDSRIAAIAVFILINLIFIKTWEAFFYKKLIRWGCLKNADSAIYFSIIVINSFCLVLFLVADLFLDIPKAWYVCAFFLIFGGGLGLAPFTFASCPKKENKVSCKSKMKCDAERLDHSRGGFHCSILGDTVGANWVWEKSPYKEKILNPPKCDARVVCRKGFLGKKYFFSCWIMKEFEVERNINSLIEKMNIRG